MPVGRAAAPRIDPEPIKQSAPEQDADPEPQAQPAPTTTQADSIYQEETLTPSPTPMHTASDNLEPEKDDVCNSFAVVCLLFFNSTF